MGVCVCLCWGLGGAVEQDVLPAKHHHNDVDDATIFQANQIVAGAKWMEAPDNHMFHLVNPIS